MEIYCATDSVNSYYYPQNQTMPPTVEPFLENQQHNYTNDDYLNQERTCSNKKGPMILRTPSFEELIVNYDDFPGEYHFSFSLNTDGIFKTYYVYSKKLSKVYITMGNPLPLRFSWSGLRSDLHLRATLVFRDEQDRSRPVQRCYGHRSPELPANLGVGPYQLRYVHRVHGIDPRAPSTLYQEKADGVLSTLTPLGTPGLGLSFVPINFQFYCQNSCPTGINRRPTKMVFTLETHDGWVLGRRSMQVQICSCPKRDKDREERELENPSSRRGKRPMAHHHQQQPAGLPRKPSCPATGSPAAPPPPPPPQQPASHQEPYPASDRSLHQVNLEVVGEANGRAVLKYAYDLMAAQAIQSGDYELYRPHLDQLLLQMQQ